MFLDALLIIPGDAYYQNYPLREYYADAIRSFRFPLWNPHEFLGIPFIGQMQTGALYPPNFILYLIFPAPYAFDISLILHFALAGFFTFLYARLMGLRPLPSFLGGCVFAFSGFLASHKPHTAIVNASVWLPLIIYFFEKLRKEMKGKYAVFASISIAVQFFAGNFQMSLYTYIVIFIYILLGLKNTGSGPRRRFLFLSLLALTLGLLIASPQIYATWELSSLSQRHALRESFGYDYFSSFHLYIEMLPSFFFPYLFGGGQYGLSSFGPWDDIVPFVGIFPLILAVIALFKEWTKQKDVRLWGIVGAAGLLLALGAEDPLNRALYKIPIYNLFRAQGRNLLEFSLASSFLFAFGLNKILYDEKSGKSYIRAAAASVLLVLLLSISILFISRAIELEGIVGFLKSRKFEKPELLPESLKLSNPAVYIPLSFMLFYLLWSILQMKKPFRLLRLIISFTVLIEAYSYGAFHEMTGLKITGTGFYDSEYSEVISGFKDKGRPSRLLPITKSPPPLIYVPRKMDFIVSYDQFAPERLYHLLNQHVEGIENIFYYNYDYLLRNNIILSLLGVRFIVIPKEWNVDFSIYRAGPGFEPPIGEDMTYGTVMVKNTDAKAAGRGFLLKKGYSAVFLSLTLEKGTYILTLDAESPGKRKPFLFVMLATEPYTTIGQVMVIFPDYINGLHYGIWGIERDGLYLLTILNGPPASWRHTKNPEPIKITSLGIKRLEKYYPPPLSDEVKKDSVLYQKVAETKTLNVYENRNVLPRAFSVSELMPAKGLDEIKKKLDMMEINPPEQAIVLENDLKEIGQKVFTKGDVRIEQYKAEEILLKVDFPEKGFLVLSEQFYPGWKAYIDGKETKIYETDGVLRGIVVHGGSHTIRFKYLPLRLFALFALSGIILAVFIIYACSKRKGKNDRDI
jgi:hypothetical protein